MKRRLVNDYILHDNFVEILLYKPFTDIVIGRIQIDLEDLEIVKRIYWTLSQYGYGRGFDKISKKFKLIHKFILNSPSNQIIDHIDLNKLNCRKENLRVVSNQVNNFKKNVYSNSKTKITGVSFVKSKNKYRSYIHLNNKYIHLGYSESIEKAIILRKGGELKYFKI